MDVYTLLDSDKIEQLQLEAARIITGLTCYCGKHVLYYETGWKTLSQIWQNRKLIIHNDLVPNYLRDLLPPINYHLSL